MATRFYLHNAAAPYTPATIRGGWNSTASAVTKKIDPWKAGSSTKAYTNFASSGTAPYSHLHYRGVSGKLAAGTIGTGTVNLCILFKEDNSPTTDAYWRVHIYVTAGDSDTVRGTLLNQYAEDTTNELPSTNLATALQSAQALSSVTVSDGDRLVVELGLVKRGTASGNGVLVYGFDAGASDASVGDDTWALNRASYIEFSETLTGGSTVVGRVSQATAEAAFAEATSAAAVTQATVEAPFGDATSAASVTQATTEVVILSDNDPQRVTQVVGELLQAQTAGLRATQVVAELLAPSVVATRVTQVVAELLSPVVIESRVTQALAEIADVATRDLRVSQIVVELLGKSSTYCGPPSLSPAALCGKADVLAWLEWTVPLRD